MSHPLGDRAGLSVETAELTFLRAPGRVLTKEYRRGPAGRIIKRSAPSAREFTVRRVLVNDFASFAAALFDAERRADECLIRGAPGQLFPRDGAPVMRRLHHETGFCRPSGTYIAAKEAERLRLQPNVCWIAPFVEVPTPYVMVDIDGIPSPDGAAWIADPEAAAEWVRDSHLPARFQDVAAWWQITASAHDPSKEDGRDLIRLRLGFWLSRALTENQLRRLFKGTPTDPATFRVVQPIYVARPVFRDGIADPIPRRSGILDGLDDAVEVPELPDAPLPKRATVRGYVPGTEGEGLHECEAFEEALAGVGSGAGECRKGLETAAFAYARAIGAKRTDAVALANRLAEVGREHRSESEVAGYNLSGLVHWVLGTLDEEPEPEPEPVPEELPTADEASAALDTAIRAFVNEALEYLPEPGKPTPHHGIKAVAGLGKTSRVLRILAEIATGRTVWYFVPTHDLAAEVAEQARALGIPAVVLKGRSRADGSGEEGAKMCRKHDVAEAVAAAGLEVWRSLCEDKNLIGSGLEHQCEHFRHCRYVRQFNGIEGKLVILSHDYLTLPKKRLGEPAMMIIDERFYGAVIRGGSFPANRIDRELPPHPEIDRSQHAATMAGLKAALYVGQHPRDHGITKDQIEAAVKAEHEALHLPAILPGMSRRHQIRLAQQYAESRETLAITRCLEILAEDFDRDGPSQRVHVAKGVEWHGEIQDRAFLHWQKPLQLPKCAPALLIDADLDPVIADQLLPLARLTEIRVRLNAEIIQVSDTVCSKRKLLEGAAGKRNRHRVAALAAHEASDGRGKVLLVSYKPVIEALEPVPGVSMAWFGAIRGLDLYRDFDTVIVAGREQPPALAVEAQARALFGDDVAPLDLPGRYLTTPSGHQRHPDPRCQALLEQARECEIEQAVARLRLVHRSEPAWVILLSNLPTALSVTRRITWWEIMPSKAETATAEACGIELLSASEMARVYPERWPSANAAKCWRRRQKGGSLSHNIYLMEKRPPFPGRVVAYRLHGHVRGSPRHAFIPEHLCEPKTRGEQALAAIVGDLAVIEWPSP